MSTPSSAYRNPGENSSGKIRSAASSPFTLLDQVRSSTLADHHRTLLLAMLRKNRFGTELWLSTESLCVIVGRIVQRRSRDATDSLGRKLSSCAQVSRRAVQRWIDDLVYCAQCGKATSEHAEDHKFVPRVEGGGVLDEVYPANSRIRYNGHIEFRHSATYTLVRQKLIPRLTYEEYRESKPIAKRKAPEPVREVPQSPVPAPSKPPIPFRPKPEIARGRSLTPRQRKDLILRIPTFMQGDGYGRSDGAGGWVGPGHPAYKGKLSKPAACFMACRSMGWTDGVSLERALEAAADAGFAIPSRAAARKEAIAAGYSTEDAGEEGDNDS